MKAAVSIYDFMRKEHSKFFAQLQKEAPELFGAIKDLHVAMIEKSGEGINASVGPLAEGLKELSANYPKTHEKLMVIFKLQNS